MQRSKFIKLTASSMVATTFLSFPAFSRSIIQDTTYHDKFFKQGNNDNYQYLINVLINTHKDPDLSDTIDLYYTVEPYGGSSNYIKCVYRFKKLRLPYTEKGFEKFDVRFDSRNHECNLNDKFSFSSERYDWSDPMYEKLKDISAFSFKPRTSSSDSETANSRYKEGKVFNSEENLWFRLEYKETEEEDCFLTTACVNHKNLPDDCEELEKLRFFRDHYMMSHPEGKEMILEYYKIAPLIVNQLDLEANDQIYDFIYNNLVLKCISLIEQGKEEYKFL